MIIRITNGPVERFVDENELARWISAGYSPVDPRPASSPKIEAEEVSESSMPEPEPVETKNEETNTRSTVIPDNLESKKVKELREIAEKVGVQGYQNMDKTTLIAVIQNH